MPKRSQDHLDARRRQILDGARRAFAHHGYEGATVTRLEQEIGLSRGAIFNYFPSKWELFYALATEDAQRLAAAWLDDGFDAALRLVGEHNPGWLGVYLELGRLMRTNPEVREQWERRVPRFVEGMLDQVRAAQAAGRMRDDVPAEEIVTFQNVILDGIAMHVGFGSPEDVDALLRLVHSALAPRT